MMSGLVVGASLYLVLTLLVCYERLQGAGLTSFDRFMGGGITSLVIFSAVYWLTMFDQNGNTSEVTIIIASLVSIWSSLWLAPEVMRRWRHAGNKPEDLAKVGPKADTVGTMRRTSMVPEKGNVVAPVQQAESQNEGQLDDGERPRVASEEYTLPTFLAPLSWQQSLQQSPQQSSQQSPARQAPLLGPWINILHQNVGKGAASLISHELLEAFLNVCPLSIVILSDQERVIFWNPAAEKTFGWKASEVVGKRLPFIPDSRREEYQRFLEATKAGKSVEAFETKRFRRDGRLLDVRVWNVPLRLDGSLGVDAMVILEDCTDRMTAREAYEQGKKAAEREANAKNAFMANLSHEMRTPLVAITSYADIIRNEALSEKERERFLDIIIRNSQLVHKLISDILESACIDGERMTFEYLSTNIREILADVISTLSYQAAAKGVTIDVCIDPHFPLQVETDPTRLKQILMNLISNAVKFTARGSIRVKARYSSQTAGVGRCVITVTDTGIGLTPEQAKRLFQPFTQAETSVNRRFGGSGLGLYLSRHIAHGLGGDVILKESAVGCGSTFELSLPLVIPHNATVTGEAGQPDKQDGKRAATPNFFHEKRSERSLEDGGRG